MATAFQIEEEDKEQCRWPPLGSPGVLGQVAIILVWVVNIIVVQIPGRLDGGGEGRESPTNLLSPAPYAFTIWPVIYSTELLFMVWMLISGLIWKESAQLIFNLMPGWVAGNLSQCIWCFTFTPAMADLGLIWVSTVFLAGTAVGLSFVHKVVAEWSSWANFFLMYVPISLHFGWVTAASLVNLNITLARWNITGWPLILGMYVSLALAMIVVIPLSISRKSALYAFVVGPWAACAVGYYTLTSDLMEAEYGSVMATVHGIIQLAVGISIFVGAVVPRFMGQQGKAASDEEHGKALNVDSYPGLEHGS